jgi:hypothetical protein
LSSITITPKETSDNDKACENNHTDGCYVKKGSETEIEILQNEMKMLKLKNLELILENDALRKLFTANM